MGVGGMGLGRLLILTKAIYSLTLTFFIQQVFFECTLFARPYLVTKDSKSMQSSPSGNYVPVGEQVDEGLARTEAPWPPTSAGGAMPAGVPVGARWDPASPPLPALPRSKGK